jgi:hypothetical protein
MSSFNGASRRSFLKYSAATGTGLLFGSSAMATPSGAPANPANFGIMFPTLRGKPFAHPDDTVRRALLEIGKRGGIMDVNEDLTAGAKRLALDPAVNGTPTALDTFGKNPFNPTNTQGTTFFGQLIDHDITFDQTSILGAPANPLLSRNVQSAALDLDTVFGKGPTVSPALYVSAKGSVGPKMKVGSGGVYEYYPYTTNPDGTPKLIMADPGRNNAVMQLEGLVLAYILAYNRVLEDLPHLDLQHLPAARQFKKPATALEHHQVAREVITWHYHWLIVNEFLPQIVGQSLVDNVLQNGNRYYNPPTGNAFMPIEFGSAAFRYGHSQVDPSYLTNFSSGTGASNNPDKAPFWGLTFDPSTPTPQFNQDNTFDRPDMLGGFPAKRRYIGWQTYFDFGDGHVMHNRKIKPALSSTLLTLPVPAIAPGTEKAPISLAQRNLLRQLTWAMPSGQTLAKEIGATPLSKADLDLIGSVYAPFATETPLWYYVLAEAKVAANGTTLGPVGGLIVAETLIGLLRSNPNSYLNKQPDFKPFLGSDLKIQNRTTSIAGSRDYGTANLLYYANVVKPGIYR